MDQERLTRDVIDLAICIADDEAMTIVQCDCEFEATPEGCWYDTKTAAQEDARDLQRAVRYLELRGLLIRRHSAEHQVRVLEEALPPPPPLPHLLSGTPQGVVRSLLPPVCKPIGAKRG